MVKSKDEVNCIRCLRRFPSHLIQPMVIATKVTGIQRIPMCPICANEILPGGLQGQMSRMLLEEAREYLAKPN